MFLTKILILAPYPLGEAPSQRFRFEHFLDCLEDHQIAYDFQSFLSEKGWQNIYKKGKALSKIAAVLSGFLRRKLLIFRLHRYDYVLIHRELTPFGPPIFEWIIAKIFRKKIIYDFDDAIWMADQGSENLLWRTLKWRSKVASICKWSWKVTAGNEYLADYARQYCEQVVVLPTVVDTEVHTPNTPHSPLKGGPRGVLGWTGSHSTLFYLNQILPVLHRLEESLDFEFLVIANKNPELAIKNFRFIKWSRETEVEDLAQIDIGVMPLEDNEWAKGKCGFKLIQYLALGIPAVASPVGVNTEIIQQDENGYLASTEEEWYQALSALLENQEKRRKLGEAGRKLIENRYSVRSQIELFVELFQ